MIDEENFLVVCFRSSSLYDPCTRGSSEARVRKSTGFHPHELMEWNDLHVVWYDD